MPYRLAIALCLSDECYITIVFYRLQVFFLFFLKFFLETHLRDYSGGISSRKVKFTFSSCHFSSLRHKCIVKGNHTLEPAVQGMYFFLNGFAQLRPFLFAVGERHNHVKDQIYLLFSVHNPKIMQGKLGIPAPEAPSVPPVSALLLSRPPFPPDPYESPERFPASSPRPARSGQ